MKLNGRGQTKTGATIHPSKRGAGSRRSERSMHSVRSRGRRHRKRRLVRELGGSRQGKHPWWFSPDDRDWLCSPDRSRRCVSLHMLVTAAEFLLGPRRHHSITRHPAMGPLSGFVAGSFSWSSRPPAFARQVARSHRDFVRFGLALPSCSGTGRPATGLWSGPESMSRPTSCQLSEEPSPPWLWSGPESMSRPTSCQLSEEPSFPWLWSGLESTS